ncbi:SGNH/GDSL hydrolase family protein [Lentisphaera profundi]|uniref:SGNH/GDSL hydrolase family protein n=1 Tax=Lentisphaera profundi TaxID=1658616 RepID=A0ABY7VNQ4_9BACT|nr:SGNH/GDSL hydrolase family protein [Lentisphaera profundi]WDE95760.1 SGNH/GDSL hydrolase family protein [Lentisphaera profundi]
MNKFLLLCLIFSAPLCAEKLNIEALDKNMAIKTADQNGIVWFSPQEKPFRLSGFKWINKESLYRRLPLTPDFAIRKAVDNLANNTSGGQIHFKTDSSKILIRAKIAYESSMYHMPATGQSSFDLYTGAPGELLYCKTARFKTSETAFTSTLFEDKKQMRNFVINFPLYNGVKSLEIGLIADSQVDEPPAFEGEGPIVVYGTSITQGGCAARPGLSYTNILSRRLNREFVNLGFSGNGRGEPALAHLINDIPNKSMIILDYEANANEDIPNSLGPFIDILRVKNPKIPILIISRILYATQARKFKTVHLSTSLALFQKDLVKSRQLAGDNNIYFLDGKSLLGAYAHEATVDGVHPNSYGFMMMAENIHPVIQQILKPKGAQ